MTIALKIELKEDWHNNCPEVYVIAKSLRHSERTVARLTPNEPVAHVCITKGEDLYFRLGEPTACMIESA